jgi:hypothetical protein
MVRIISLAICSVVSIKLYACICAPIGDGFFDTVQQHNLKVARGEYPQNEALIIFSGKVLNYEASPRGQIPKSMLVEVHQLLQGEISTKEIWLDGDTDGMQCRPPVINFKIDSNYIFAINRDENQRNYISICGQYTLKTKPVIKKSRG